MRTEAQQQAARENGRRYRGPITDQGKRIAARNSTRHGILAETIVLEGENRAYFDEIMADLLEEHQPRTETELHLVGTMASTEWRLIRLQAIENRNLLLEMTGPDAAPAQANHSFPSTLTLAFRNLAGPNRTLDLLERYQSSLLRQHTRAVNMLARLRHTAGAPPNPPQPPSQPTNPTPDTQPSETPLNETNPAISNETNEVRAPESPTPDVPPFVALRHHPTGERVLAATAAAGQVEFSGPIAANPTPYENSRRNPTWDNGASGQACPNPLEESILIRGARVHNLKDITLAIPHNVLTVVTGVSGSGKSSLVFDTIYAEGQRRYVESLSAYARQFLERMEKPDVDEILGIAPPIAIRQKNTTRNPRSTVATSTEVYDFLRLLFARVGRSYCPKCGDRVIRDTVDQVAQTMLREPEGTRWYALFPIHRAETADALRDHLFDLRRKGFNRLLQNGRTFEFSTPESLLDIDFNQPLFGLVDRLAINPDLHQRIVDAIEICYRESGEVIFEMANGERSYRFSEKFACKRDGIELSIPEPGLFSFNNPMGACPRCQGFGNTIDYAMDLIVPNTSLSLNDGAVDPWTKPQYSYYFEDNFKPSALRAKVRLAIPFSDLRAEEKKFVYEHVFKFFAEVEHKKYKVHVRVFLSRYRGYTECPECHGSRLRPEALNVCIGDATMGDLVKLNIAKAYAFFDSLELSPEERKIADKILVEIRQRLKFLNDVGLDYLTLDRLAATLSGGEAQRIQLATCLGSRLVGACYVLDEPSIGLHSRDTGRLIRILQELRDLGNTIVVVEHDPDVMRAADHIVDMGPGAGELGGKVIFEGSFATMMENGASSLTAKYLKGELKTAQIAARREINAKKQIRFFGARLHNLTNIDVTIPLNMMVAITGVSGSGKSTLVHDVIYRTLEKRLMRETPSADVESVEGALEKVTCSRVEKVELLKQVLMVDQSPIGRTPRSNPVTYIKAFDQIRELFASTKEADKRGYNAGHFSFNIPGGRCEVCQGDGTVTVEMQFLADVELICEECKGTRYKSSILDIRYKGLNIHEVLQLTVKEAQAFFADVPRLLPKLKVLYDVGLGYLRLGQSATTLSGGEAQRVKLASHLAQSSSAGTLFIFDEPTTGLHFDDIAKLLDAFQRLIHNGGSILIIEHNMDVIRSADWVIDLGPEGGDGGGRIVAQGTPEQVAAVEASYTGRYLRPMLAE